MKELILKTIKTYGKENQLTIAQEEMAELIQSISKDKRGIENSRESIVEEVADVEIILEQLKVIYEIEPEEVDKQKEYKIERLKERIRCKNDKD